MSDNFPLGYFAVEQFVFARLDEDAARPGADPQALAALRMLAAWHSIEVHKDGVSYWRCATCDLTHGAPCSTLRWLAWLWHDHPDFPEFARDAMSTDGLGLLGKDAADAGGWFRLAYPDHPPVAS